ncbi:MAG: hypothetical protein KKH98_13300 [Spirochaetes bacterium]|nr:hypothetical protein [Spirochaetota bacterium]
MILSQEQYCSGDKFENPYSKGHKVYLLHVYPDPKFDNNWVAALCGEDEEINDKDRIIVDRDEMKTRLGSSVNGRPFISRSEVKRLLTRVLSRNTNEIITFTK